MVSVTFAPESSSQRIALSKIDSVVSSRLGSTRELGNAQPACFNRQVAMYLAKYVGRWSTTVVGRFYNGRDHSTVCHAIQKIEALRDSNPDLDCLLSNLKRELVQDDCAGPQTERSDPDSAVGLNRNDLERLVDAVAERVYERLRHKPPSGGRFETLNSEHPNELL